eukprot:g1673.t1
MESEVETTLQHRKKYLQESAHQAQSRLRQVGGKGEKRGAIFRLFPVSNAVRLEHYFRYARVKSKQSEMYLEHKDYDNAYKHLWSLSKLLIQDIPKHNAYNQKVYAVDRAWLIRKAAKVVNLLQEVDTELKIDIKNEIIARKEKEENELDNLGTGDWDFDQLDDLVQETNLAKQQEKKEQELKRKEALRIAEEQEIKRRQQEEEQKQQRKISGLDALRQHKDGTNLSSNSTGDRNKFSSLFGHVPDTTYTKSTTLSGSKGTEGINTNANSGPWQGKERRLSDLLGNNKNKKSQVPSRPPPSYRDVTSSSSSHHSSTKSTLSSSASSSYSHSSRPKPRNKNGTQSQNGHHYNDFINVQHMQMVAQKADKMFRQNLTRRPGVPLEVYDVPMDGNCLFHAVSHQLFGTIKHHARIRRECCNFMYQNHARFSLMCENPGEFKQYISARLHPVQDGYGEWGDDPEIRAMEELYDRPIEIFSVDHGPIEPMPIHFDGDIPNDVMDSHLPIRITCK